MSALDRSIVFGFALLVSLPQMACVTRGTYNTTAEERDQLESRVESLTREKDALTRQLEKTATEKAQSEAAAVALIRELESELEAGEIEVRQLVDGVQVEVADALLFQSGSATLSAKGIDVLSRVAGQLKDEDAIIFVEGHTDSYVIPPGSKIGFASNWELGAARAARVVKRLSADGVDPTRLRAVSFGPFDPIAPNTTPEGRAKNRRTEIVVRHVQR